MPSESMSFYLVAGLPMLDMDEAPPWTPEEFNVQCEGVLEPDDARELRCFVEDRAQEGQSDFARWWADLDTQIRNTLARLRAARLGVDARSWQRMHSGFDVTVEQGVLDAMQHANPRERELGLDRCRWAALDDRTAAHPFGFETVCAYALRLRILQRWAGLDAETGRERIETFIAEQTNQALEPERIGDE